MNKKTFCLLVNAMKKQYDTDVAIYNDLKNRKHTMLSEEYKGEEEK